MSQDIWSTINPSVTSGTMLASLLNSFKDAIVSGCSGTSRPANLQAGGMWVDTTNSLTPNFYYSVKVYTGTADLEIFRVNINSNFGSAVLASSEMDITKISADTTAAILGMIKQRTLTNGQLLDGDVIGEIQFVGCTDTATNPVVGNIKWTSSDSETNSVYGGYLSLYSVPDASNTISEHVRFITGLVETVKPQKVNSLRLVGQNVATAAAITQLDASKVLVEFTGSTATDLKGINSGQDSQEVTIHNRSTATVTLKHQNAGAAAADRFKLPNGLDVSILADASAILYYCTTDTRWKIKGTAHSVMGKNVKQVRGIFTDWVCPANVTRVLVTPFKRKIYSNSSHASAIDIYGNVYVWGQSANGGVGDGTQVSKSSPVAIAGGTLITRFATGKARIYNLASDSSYGITNTGVLMAWGLNSQGQLGVGDVLARSTPTAVLGGKKWAFVVDTQTSAAGVTLDGFSYAWGKTPFGTLSGAGGSVLVSSPVAILGGLTFESMEFCEPAGNGDAMCGVDSTGTGYFWGGGGNASFIKGGGGNGVPTIALSSPVAVIGGLTFKKMTFGVTNGNGVWALGLNSNGTLYAWGDNTFGQLGVGDITPRSSPVAVLGGRTFVDCWIIHEWSASSGSNQSSAIAIADDGTLYAWGGNADGQLGVGDTLARSSPVAVLGGQVFKEVITGVGNTNGGTVYAINSSGDMYAWGYNGGGELGVGDVVPRSSPVAVLGGIKWAQFARAVGSSVNGTSVTAVSADGYMYSWGQGGDYNGTNDAIAHSSPVAVVGGFTIDTRTALEVISIPVTAGNTYRIYMPVGKYAKFGSVGLGFNIERVSLEYDIRGN